MSNDDGKSGGGDERGRLSRSGRIMPLVKPPTLAPPVAGQVEADEYDEVIVDAPAVWTDADASDPADSAAEPPRRWWHRLVGRRSASG